MGLEDNNNFVEFITSFQKFLNQSEFNITNKDIENFFKAISIFDIEIEDKKGLADISLPIFCKNPYQFSIYKKLFIDFYDKNLIAKLDKEQEKRLKNLVNQSQELNKKKSGLSEIEKQSLKNNGGSSEEFKYKASKELSRNISNKEAKELFKKFEKTGLSKEEAQKLKDLLKEILKNSIKDKEFVKISKKINTINNILSEILKYKRPLSSNTLKKKIKTIENNQEKLQKQFEEELAKIQNNKETLKDNFGLELIGANQKYLLRKYSMKDSVGINGKDDKTLYILFALILSGFTLRNAGDFIPWTTEFESACNKYAEEYCDGKKLTSREQYMYSKDILKYLIDNGYISEVKKDEEKDNEQFECYKLEIDIDQKLYKEIVLNKFLNGKNEIEQGKIKVLQTLLLNGYISKSENEEEYNLVKNKEINEAVSKIFRQLLNSDGVGFELIEWSNHYMLSYKGASGFPNPNNNEGMLAIEILSMLEPGETYTFDELVEKSKLTMAFKNRSMIKNKLNSSLRSVLNNLISFGFLSKEEDKYYANGIVKNIKVNYIDEEDKNEQL